MLPSRQLDLSLKDNCSKCRQLRSSRSRNANSNFYTNEERRNTNLRRPRKRMIRFENVALEQQEKGKERHQVPSLLFPARSSLAHFLVFLYFCVFTISDVHILLGSATVIGSCGWRLTSQLSAMGVLEAEIDGIRRDILDLLELDTVESDHAIASSRQHDGMPIFMDR